MDHERQSREIDRNYDALMRVLSTLLPRHRDEIALMRDGEIVGLYKSVRAANREGMARFPDQIFSLQEVTDEPLDLGYWGYMFAAPRPNA